MVKLGSRPHTELRSRREDSESLTDLAYGPTLDVEIVDSCHSLRRQCPAHAWPVVNGIGGAVYARVIEVGFMLMFF